VFLVSSAPYHVVRGAWCMVCGMCCVAGTDEDELGRTLQSLALGPLPLLLQEPKGGKKIKPSDSFKVNHAFKHQLFRIKVNSVQSKEKVSLRTLASMLCRPNTTRPFMSRKKRRSRLTIECFKIVNTRYSFVTASVSQFLSSPT